MAPHLMALVRAGAKFRDGLPVRTESPDPHSVVTATQEIATLMPAHIQHLAVSPTPDRGNPMALAPIVLFVYNRLEHTRATVESLMRNHMADQSDLFVFSDGPRDARDQQHSRDRERVRQVREYLRTIDGFRTVAIYESPTNLGLARSVISGVSKVIDARGRAIVIEDDLQFSRDFVAHMNHALDFYQEDPAVFQISGYCPPFRMPRWHKHDVFLSHRPCSWGWATWKDRWDSVDWEISDYDAFKGNPWQRLMFSRGGADMAKMLDAQVAGRIDSWAIRFCYAQFRQRKFTVYPVRSLVDNRGTDGSGTHGVRSRRWSVALSNDAPALRLERLDPDPAVLLRFHEFMSGGYGHLLWAKAKRLAERASQALRKKEIVQV